jgi:GNAT superfamily N-acetyltransferase
LSSNEIVNHGILSLAEVLTSPNSIYQPPFIFAHVRRDEEISGCWIYAEPDGLTLSDLAPETQFDVFEHLRKYIHLPSRIFGPRESALRLAQLFGETSGTSYKIDSVWRVHYLKDLAGQSILVDGSIRIAEMKDSSLVSKWGEEYNTERPANVDIKQFLLQKLIDKNLHLWVDEDPKSLATISGGNCSGPRISSVYTPPEFRSHGYATALVKNLSRKFLRAGRPYVTLNTLLGDPVEQIYRRLGYRPVAEKVSVTFEET